MPLVSSLTGLPARWSGRVELVADADFKGKKRFSCDIQIALDLAKRDVRWATLVHESLHCHSAGYNGTAYREHRGWEEGVVEQLQRLFRSQILSEIGVRASDLQTDFQDADNRHPFNDHIEALEALRRYLVASELDFYRHLLSVPIAERSAEVLRQIQQLPILQRTDFIYTFSASQAVLKQYPVF